MTVDAPESEVRLEGPRSPAEELAARIAHYRSPGMFAREAVPTGEMVTLTSEQKQARKRRSMWLALGLIAFVLLVFTLTMTKMGANILVRDL